jgi:hypothetical protein
MRERPGTRVKSPSVVTLEGLEDWSVEGHQALQAKCLAGHAMLQPGLPMVLLLLFAVEEVSCGQISETQTQVPLLGLQYTLLLPLGLLVTDVPSMATYFVSDQSSDALSNNLLFVQV